MATALACPTITTSFLPRVMPACLELPQGSIASTRLQHGETEVRLPGRAVAGTQSMAAE